MSERGGAERDRETETETESERRRDILNFIQMNPYAAEKREDDFILDGKCFFLSQFDSLLFC